MTPRRSISESVSLLVVRLGLAALFCAAAWGKLTDPQSFAESVKAFKILPDHLTVLATFTIPWAELLCGLLLALGLWARAGALVLSLLLAAFTAGILSVLARKTNVECGCFGRKFYLLCSNPTLGWCNVGQDALLLAGSLLLLVRGPGSASLDRAVD